MLPDESAAKARQLVDQMIAALGGPAYLGVRDVTCEGRISFFGHAGDLTGYEIFHDYWKSPDKNRSEHGKKGIIVDIYNGSHGWTLDKGGVTELSEDQIQDFQEQTKRNLNQLLRFRLKEEGLVFRYGGNDVVDLRQVDWVEIADRDRRTFRIAVDRSTHFPVRSVVSMRNAETREIDDVLNYYSDYHSESGIQTPFQVTRERNDRKLFQAFFTGCKYNTNLSDDLFSRASLENRYSTSGKKNKRDKQ
ncbi:MAG TPA: hypothetical protein VOA41_13490 [Candidatus Dormibacteraeota bacterium]|nr:hypothetical protein [Candidatus Dormibacteraeota bacterium]